MALTASIFCLMFAAFLSVSALSVLVDMYQLVKPTVITMTHKIQK